MSAKEKAKKLKTPKGKKVDYEVTLPLSDKEKVKRGEQAFALLEKQNDLEAEFVNVKKAWKEDIASCSTRARKLLEEFGTGREKKTVQVTEFVNFETKKVEYWYGGKIVGDKKMDDVVKDSRPKSDSKKATGEDDEKQPTLQFGGQAPLKAPIAELAGKKPDADKACVATPGKKPPRGQKQSLDDQEERDPEIAAAMREETGRKTKSSSVDGARP